MKDRIILQKIQNYIQRIAPIYETIKDMPEHQLLELNDSFALTQYLTNIHSLFQNISSDEIFRLQVDFGIKALSTCRNIAAHDYDSLDWARVKQICKKLLSENTAQLFVTCYEIITEHEKTRKDYTQ